MKKGNNPYAALNKERRRRRLAMVITYLSSLYGALMLPPYFDLFATSAAGLGDDINYLIFHCKTG
jgi:hypothetical protein